MDYCCSNCGYQYNIEALNNKSNKINDDVYQCPNCWFIGHLIKVRSINTECMICLEKTYNKKVFTCGHWVCTPCYDKMYVIPNEDIKLCCYCSSQISAVFEIQSNKPIIQFPSCYNAYYRKLLVLVYKVCGYLVSAKNEFDRHHKRMELLNEYHKWLKIVSQYTATHVSPSPLIDEVWHTHIIDTENYSVVCELLYNGFIDHYPENSFIGDLDNKQKRIENTKRIYAELYGTMNPTYWDYQIIEENNKYYLYVKTLTGKTLKIPYLPAMTLKGLKAKIQDIEGIPPCQQRLIFAGRQLDNDKRLLTSCFIFGGSKLDLILRLSGC